MKVLHVTPDYPPNLIGGIGIHVSNLHDSLLKAGVDSHVISTWPTNSTDDRIHVPPVFGHNYECGDKPLGNTLFEIQKSSGAAVTDLGSFIPEVVHAHDYRAIIAAETLAYKYSAALVITKHSMHPLIKNPDPSDSRRTLFYSYVDALQREGFNRADQVILLTQEMEKTVASYKKELNDLKKVHIIPNGVHIPLITESPERDNNSLIFVGRLELVKGPDLLLEAIRQLSSSFASKLHVHIIGKGSLEPNLRAAAAALNNGTTVTFHGFLPPETVAYLFKKSTLCVVPSRHDVFPLTSLESMANNTPVIATGVGGLIEQLGNGTRGILVDPDNPEKLAKAIEYSFTHLKIMHNFAVQAQKWVSSNCSWENVTNQTISVYRTAISSRSI